MSLPERLRNARELKGYTRQKLAEETGIALSSLYFYEKGERIPSADVIQKISKALNVSTAYFFEEIDTLEIPKPNKLPDFVKEQITKIDELKSLKLSEKLEIIGNELIDISKKIKDFE
ncbi:Helix-turn-helix [Marinitoga hydrogenitolerans DSM 16785]|uniref:Helix-turn-helix n=1 Tax=Marinitoga hydrogenitolerans (strain DSM 16785 / JCM 12826 / AT1271) TaxID=1122195 RepID=A0A1M4TS46_MARH1|nr:helix-turn-helix transcriptional regulator [Marinitoga hydrogenitolerans]SHE47127.1 Helix-turn-helix [Marinitoga hydrogenitolerans DSM 16785]